VPDTLLISEASTSTRKEPLKFALGKERIWCLENIAYLESKICTMAKLLILPGRDGSMKCASRVRIRNHASARYKKAITVYALEIPSKLLQDFVAED
jgi:hypothetical protein